MKFDLDIPKMGYFILVRNEGGLIGNGIQANQIKAGFLPEDAKYTHVMVSGGGQWTVNPVPPRLKISDLTKDYAGKYIKIVSYDDPTFEEKRYKVAFWAATHTNLPYDGSGVLNFIIKWFHQSTSNWFCSENALWALQKEYPQAFIGLKPEQCMPAHFSRLCKTIWEGIIE